MEGRQALAESAYGSKFCGPYRGLCRRGLQFGSGQGPRRAAWNLMPPCGNGNPVKELVGNASAHCLF